MVTPPMAGGKAAGGALHPRLAARGIFIPGPLGAANRSQPDGINTHNFFYGQGHLSGWAFTKSRGWAPDT